jgi:CheY-like chemotaxis protein
MTSSETEGPIRRVLVVEDDFYVASSLTHCLEAENVEVVGPVASVREALGVIVEGTPIDGAILDINLKGEMVYSVADALRERGVRYVFTTGYDAGSIAQRQPDAPCFEKPVIATQLIAALFDRSE